MRGIGTGLLVKLDRIGDNSFKDHADAEADGLAGDHADERAEKDGLARVAGGEARDNRDREGGETAAGGDDLGEGSAGQTELHPGGPNRRQTGGEVGMTAHGLDEALT